MYIVAWFFSPFCDQYNLPPNQSDRKVSTFDIKCILKRINACIVLKKSSKNPITIETNLLSFF